MKKLISLFAFFLILNSCEKKEAFVPGNEIPDWLQTQIQQNELALQQNPKNLVISGSAWIRYKWNNEYYFEYRNMVSSSFAYPISFERDTLKVCPVCIGTDYYDNKCCKQFVWKGANYIEPED
jgi:hypothetical protein